MPDLNRGRVHVLGAGIVGICTALSLLEKGFQVTLIDRDPPGAGASHGNAGVVSPWSCVPQSMPGLWRQIPRWLLDPEGPLALRWSHAPRMLPWLVRFLKAGHPKRLPAMADAMNALNRPNVEIYRQHLAGTGHEDLLVDSAYLHVFRDPAAADLEGLAWRLRRERGVPLRRVEGAELREIEPELSPDYKAAILIADQARATDPGALARALAEKAARMGARFHRAEATRLVPENPGWRVETPAGPIHAETLVLAAGAWSARLLAPLGLRLPLEAERGYHLMFADPGVAIRNSVMDVEAKFVASSMRAGLRCAGTAEFAGLDAPPDYRRAEIFGRLGKRLFPRLDTTHTTAWMGTRPSFPDSLPAIGALPGLPGLVAAFGHCHYGFGMAPNTGRIVAGLVAGEPPNIDLSPYAAARFA